MSQICNLGLGLFFMSFISFSNLFKLFFSRLHEIKTMTVIKKLRHLSL